MVSFGIYGEPRYTVLHLSDTHLLAHDGLLGESIAPTLGLERAIERIRTMRPQPDAIVFTGDLTDLGEPAAYTRLRDLIEPLAAELGAPVVWAAGNHDERPAMREALLDLPASAEPITSVHTVGGLRIICLDSTVPGWHHGDLDSGQLAWLREVLATPAVEGTVLVMHHPPLPSHVPLFDILELRNQQALAEVIAGTDVRAILAGHLHYATTGTFAGIPVSVAAATCYTMDLALPPEEVNGMDAGQSFNLVHVWEDTITHAVVPVAGAEPADAFGPSWYREMAALTPEERLQRFSRKPAR